MADFSMLLEDESLYKKPQVVTEVSNSLLHLVQGPAALPPGTHTFSISLQNCYLCRKRLLEGMDIYMYRERAFCTEECRSWQINMDKDGSRVRQSSSSASDGAEEAPPRRRRRSGAVDSKAEL